MTPGDRALVCEALGMESVRRRWLFRNDGTEPVVFEDLCGEECLIQPGDGRWTTTQERRDYYSELPLTEVDESKWPPIDTDDTAARQAMEAARDRDVIIRAWPCHDRRFEPDALPSGGWWARWLGADQSHRENFPGAVSAALLEAVRAGAFGGGE